MVRGQNRARDDGGLSGFLMSLNGDACASSGNGRFAPSPTGPLHLGNLRTAVLAWLFACSAGARFLLRVEDLDRSRVRPGVEGSQIADLAALGLDWDGPVFRQSERGALYEEAIAHLAGNGLLYPCYCTRAEIQTAVSAPHGITASDRYPGTCGELSAAEHSEKETSGRPPALRVRADGARAGETPEGVLARIAVSIGLAEPGEKPSLTDMLPGFDPARLPREPTIWSPTPDC